MLKRSEINRSIEIARRVFAANGLHLPEFAFRSVAEWDRAGHECDEIRDCMLGWDVTDFGSGDFRKTGRTLFTLRNGRRNDPRYPKSSFSTPIFSARRPTSTAASARISSIAGKGSSSLS